MSEDIEKFAREFLRSIVNPDTGEIALDNASASMPIAGRVLTISINNARPKHLGAAKIGFKDRLANYISREPVSVRVLANRMKVDPLDCQRALDEMVSDGAALVIVSKRRFRGAPVVKYMMASNASA